MKELCSTANIAHYLRASCFVINP